MFMGSPVLTDDRFGAATADARAAGVDSRMTVGGTALAAGVLLVLLCVAGAFGWSSVTQTEPVQTISRTGEVVTSNPTIPTWIFLVGLGGVIVGIVGSFLPRFAMITGPIYALCYGLLLGGISAVYNQYYSGIVTQAVLATFGIFLAMLFLYATRIIKVTNRFVMVVAGAVMGIFLMYMIAAVASLFGANLYFWNNPTPIGFLVSGGIIVIAAMMLAVNFAFIEGQVQAGAPRYLEWYAAYGLVVTLVWLYLQVLQFIALLNRR